MLTTSLRLASASFFFASSSPSSILLASSVSSSALKRGTLPISFRYIRTGSSIFMPSGRERSISFSTSSSVSIFPITSTPWPSRYSYTLSIWSVSSSISPRLSIISLYSSTPLWLFPRATSSLSLVINKFSSPDFNFNPSLPN